MCRLLSSLSSHCSNASFFFHNASCLDLLLSRPGLVRSQNIRLIIEWSAKTNIWLLLLSQILTYVVLAAGAVSAEVLYLAYKGDDAITWSDACSSYGSFCHRATASVIITFFVVCFYVVLSIISSYKLFTRFDPPAIVDSKNLEVAVFGSWLAAFLSSTSCLHVSSTVVKVKNAFVFGLSNCVFIL